MNFNMNNLIKDIKSLDKQQCLEAGINELTYYKLKDNPQYIFDVKASTLIKILEITSDINQNMVIGIDVNQCDFFTAATSDLSLEYTSGINVQDEYFNQFTKDKVNQRFQCHAGRSINELKKLLPENTTFTYVIGSFNLNKKGTWEMHHKSIYYKLKSILKDGDRIYMIDESCSSRICPSCGFKSKLNRTDDNRFDCINCDYEHRNNDIQAASTIATMFIDNPQAINITQNLER